MEGTEPEATMTKSPVIKKDQIESQEMGNNAEKNATNKPSVSQLTENTANSNTKKPKKLELTNNHKLSSNELEKIGIKIVSPGLPPLSSKMSKMVLKSKSIAEQQKKLIALKNGGGESNHFERQEIIMEDAQAYQESLIEEDDDELVIPSPKKLKREKLPTPLNIQGRRTTVNPLIRSAPLLRNGRRRPTLRYHNLQQQQQQPNPFNPYFQQHLQHQMPRFYPTPFYPYFYPPLIPQLIPEGHRPISTNRVQFLNRNGTFSSSLRSTTASASTSSSSTTTTSSSSSSSATSNAVPPTSGSNPVIDVFPTGVMKEAPIVAQPLSAQHLRFSEREREDAGDDVESIAIEDNLVVDNESSAGLEILGEIKLNDDLFYYTLNTSGDLQNDREKFLKFCSNAWDEFVKLV